MALIRMRTALLAKKESVYRTDPAPTPSSNAVEVYDPTVSYEHSVVNLAPLSSGLSKAKPIVNRRYATIGFKVDLKGAGAAGSVPDWGPLLEACGYSQVIASGTSVTYEPESSGHASVTLHVFQDGLLHKVTGCRGNARFMVGVEATPMIDFSFMGVIADGSPEAGTFPASVTVDTTHPVASKDGTFSFGGAARDIASLELDTGNTVGLTDSINDASGYGESVISDRSPTGTFDPEQTVANNIMALMYANAEHALAWANGGAAGNIVQINCPKATLTSVTESERAGVLTYSAAFVPARDSGDDEIEVIVR